MAKIRLRLVQKAELDDETASLIASDYYDVIKGLLTALLLKTNIKSDNHECLIRFFKKNYSHDEEVETIYQLKNVRNRVEYDGIFIKKEYILRNRLEFEHIIKLLEGIMAQ